MAASAPKMADGVWKGKEVEKKRIVKIAVHYPRASQPPERQSTGTPTAHANSNANYMRFRCNLDAT